MSMKVKIVLGIIVVLAFVSIFIIMKAVETCEPYEVHVIRYLGLPGMGSGMIVRQQAGLYFTKFGRVTKYQRVTDCKWNDDVDEGDKEDESINVIFNDTGRCGVSTFVRYEIPSDDENILKMHSQFGGDPERITRSVKSITNASLVATATTMSTTDYAVKKRVQFINHTRNQMQRGLYTTETVKIEIANPKNPQKKIYKEITRFMKNENGQYIIDNQSSLAKVKIIILQFDVVGDDWDKQTEIKFADRQKALLEAETKKAETYKAEQEELKVIAEGKKNVAVEVAIANVKIASTEGKAREEVAKAEQEKLKAIINAEKRAAEAKLEADKAEIEAKKRLTVAKLDKETADQRKLATIADAEARQQAIELSGALSESRKFELEIWRDTNVEVAIGLSKVNVPQYFFAGGGRGTGDGIDAADGSALKSSLTTLLLFDMVKSNMDKDQLGPTLDR